MKGQKFLKVTGILMIIGAALSILFGVIIGGVGALIAKFAGASTLGFAFYLGLGNYACRRHHSAYCRHQRC